LGVGGLGCGAWGPTPNPQSPIPNPQSPIPFIFSICKIQKKLYIYFLIII